MRGELMTKKSFFIIMAALAAVALIGAATLLLRDRTAPAEGTEPDPGPAKLPDGEKYAWLAAHPEDYDAFILGSCAVCDPTVLNEYLDASFYNLTSAPGDMKTVRDTAAAVLGTYGTRHIVLTLGLGDLLGGDAAAGGYAAVLPETGAADTRARDREYLGTSADYEAAHASDFALPAGPLAAEGVEACLAAVRDVAALCAASGARLTVVLTPEYGGLWALVPAEALRRFREELVAVTDYWDFALSPLSYDSRRFYDAYHPRAATAALAMAAVFGGEEVWRPEGFGFYVTVDNEADYLDTLFEPARTPSAPPSDAVRDVPVLLYHHFAEAPADPANVSPEALASHLEVLRAHGYTTVSLQELTDFVNGVGTLPEKPVLLTFDDGYLSNYELAYPVLQAYNAKAVIFPIGVSVGKVLYKDTEYVMTPHFGFDEAREMTASGLVEIGSHTWDMHQWPPFESGDGVRETVLPLEGESDEAYTAALRADLARYDEVVRRELGQEGFLALAYPSGRYNDLSEAVIHDFGIPVTLTTRSDRRNLVLRALPQSLYALSRWYVTDDTTPEELLKILEG